MKILKKLKSRRGETLVELLVSMAILTLSICFMVTMIMLSTKFDEQARNADKAYRDALDAVENYEGTETPGTVKLVPDSIAGTSEQSITVKVYSSADGKLKSYRISP